MPAGATCCSPSSAASSSITTPSATARRCCASTATCRAPSSTSFSRLRSPTTRPPAGGGCRRSAPASAATVRSCASTDRMASASTVLPRILEPETLDHLAPDDPEAQRSRRDLRRVNTFMGARLILARALDRATRDDRREPLRIVELGCGDGRLMLDVARHRGERWPAATIAAYAAAGWHARPVVADVFDWADAAHGERWDVVVANLFLHHFEGAALSRVLAG